MADNNFKPVVELDTKQLKCLINEK
jgi:hypothetical protein